MRNTERNYTTDELRAVNMLNEKKQQHPPAVFYVRRNRQMLEKYLDKDEQEKILAKMRPQHRMNFKLFDL